MKTANMIRNSIIGALLIISFALHAQSITFSMPGGFYEQTFHLTLSCDNQEAVIRFTTNGNQPTEKDAVYDSPLLLDEHFFSNSNIYTIVDCPQGDFYLPDDVQKCIVIRAAAFDMAGNRIGEVATNSYFIKSLGCHSHGLPAVSICADSLDLFDFERGIFVPGVFQDPSNPEGTGNYYQSGREWERPANFEFYELDNTGVNQAAGLRTHGGNGRKLQQKSLKVYARNEYGAKRFEYPFFKSLSYDSFKRLVFKPFTASWALAGVYDHISNQIAAKLDLETVASRPVVLYLNGEYWGIYYIHEKPDEHYLEDRCQANSEDINIIEGWDGLCEAGSNDRFLALYDFIANNDLSEPENYSYVASQMDINNFIDYQILEIFIANLDWPVNNMRCWQDGDGPWRWIFFDGDIALIQKEFDAFANATYNGPSGYPASSRSTLFLRKLLEKETFKVDFINRFNQLLRTAFAYETTKKYIDDAYALLKGEVPNQVARFNNPDEYKRWTRHISGVDIFLEQRKDFILNQMRDYHIADDYDLAIDAIFPSPAQSEIHIMTDFEHTALTSLQIFDLVGRQLYSEQRAFGKGKSVLSMPIHLSSGVYLLRIGEKTRKFVVVD